MALYYFIKNDVNGNSGAQFKNFGPIPHIKYPISKKHLLNACKASKIHHLMKSSPLDSFLKFYVMTSTQVDLYGIAHVKVDFILLQKMYVIPMLKYDSFKKDNQKNCWSRTCLSPSNFIVLINTDCENYGQFISS